MKIGIFIFGIVDLISYDSLEFLTSFVSTGESENVQCLKFTRIFHLPSCKKANLKRLSVLEGK